jgi:hypothetical protein
MHHRTYTLASPWSHQPPTEITAFAVENLDRPDTTRNRASVVLDCGSFELRLCLTAADLRALSALLLATAEDQEAANAPPQQVSA